MRALARLASWISRALAYVGTVAVMAMMVHICLDVVLRNLFNIAMNTTPEIVARYYMTGIAFLPLAWLEARGQMISVELLDFAMTKRMRHISDGLVLLVATFTYGLLAWAAWPKALSETRTGAFVELVSFQMPVWHSYYIPAFGFSLAALACLFGLLAFVSPRVAAELELRTDER